MKEMMTTKEVAAYLSINEKMVYSLISEKGLPATKLTGKWLFPLHLVRQWIEAGTQNFPAATRLPPYHGLILVAGSDDLLLQKLISTFNRKQDKHLIMFAARGSMGGINVLRQNLCHIAASHMADENQNYHFPFLKDAEHRLPAVINLSKREQGLAVKKGNPRQILEIADLARPGIRVANRPVGTGTRQMFDNLLKAEGIKTQSLIGYETSYDTHMNVGLSVLKGNADAGLCIRPVATLLGLDFISLDWERFDLLVIKERFFDQGIQLFLSMLKGRFIQQAARDLGGYDLSITGKMIYGSEDHTLPE